MSSKSENSFRHFEKMMKHSGRRQERATDIPAVCRVCPYYQPKFKYRKCLFSSCSFGKKDVSVFRKHPLYREKFHKKEMDTAVERDKAEGGSK